MSERIAYLLTFDGCPYGFGTAGCPTSITSSDSDWSSAWTIVNGFLKTPRGTISERLATSDSQLQVSGFTFQLHDHPVSTGPYAGVDRLCSYLFTRRPSQIAHAAIVSPGYVIGDSTFTLANATGFASGQTVVWIDQEAIRQTRSGSTCTVNDVGYYGSRSAHHQTDDARGFAPVVWSSFPGIARRRAILWVVRDGVATPRWRGRVMPGPSLSQDEDSAGEVFDIPCEQVWTHAKESPIGIEPGTARLIGFPSFNTSDLAASWRDAIKVTIRQGTLEAVSSGSSHYDAASLDELFLRMANELRGFMVAKSYDEPSLVWFERDEQDRVRLVATGPTTADLNIEVTVVGVSGAALAPSRQFKSERWVDSGSVRRAEVVLDALPSAWITGLANSTVSRTLLLDDATALPAGSGRITATILPATVVVQRVLRGKVGDDWSVVLENFSTSVADSTVGGYLRLEPRSPALRAVRAIIAIDKPVEIKSVGQCIAPHWMYGLHYGLLGTTGSRVLRTPADPRDWVWDLEAKVIAQTAGPRAVSGVRWYFDGSEKLGESITDLTRLNGCAVCVRSGGRLSIAPLRPPIPTDAVTATLTSADYLEPPQYETLPEGIANSAKLESDTLSITVNQLDSEGRYGVARQVGLKLIGKSDVASTQTPSASALALQLLRFVLGTWSEPIDLHRITVSAEGFDETIYTGDVIEFDSDIAPDGTGGRGLTAQLGIVIGKDAELFEHDRLVLEVITFPTRERLGAFAPCVRLASISGTSLSVETAYFGLSDGATDYAGSNLSGYRGTANDGGAWWFRAGYKCRIVAIDQTNAQSQGGLTVASVSGSTITLTGSVPTTVRDWAAFLAGGGLADLVFDDYGSGSLTTEQKEFACVGSESAQVIDGTSDTLNRLGP